MPLKLDYIFTFLHPCLFAFEFHYLNAPLNGLNQLLLNE